MHPPEHANVPTAGPPKDIGLSRGSKAWVTPRLQHRRGLSCCCLCLLPAPHLSHQQHSREGVSGCANRPHFVPHPCTALQQVGLRECQSLPSCAVRPGVWLPKLTGSSRSTHVPGEKAWSSQGESRKKKEQGARGASRPLAPKDLAETVRYNRRWTKR